MSALYDKYICQHYGLDILEPWMELPLDSHVAKGLKSEPEGASLPRWHTVVGLLPEASLAFQRVASEVAKRKKTHRVHLDLLYWRGDHMANQRVQRTDAAGR
jgi:hypothetical protein